jgi:hypothetical protein
MKSANMSMRSQLLSLFRKPRRSGTVRKLLSNRCRSAQHAPHQFATPKVERQCDTLKIRPVPIMQ